MSSGLISLRFTFLHSNSELNSEFEIESLPDSENVPSLKGIFICPRLPFLLEFTFQPLYSIHQFLAVSLILKERTYRHSRSHCLRSRHEYSEICMYRLKETAQSLKEYRLRQRP